VQWVVKICLATQTHPGYPGYAVFATKVRDECVSTLGITLYECNVHVRLETKKELSIGVYYVLVVGLAVPVAGEHFLVIGRVGGYVFPSGIVTLDQIIFVTKQKGIQEIVLHHLFKGPGLYGD
jgi:hypothetical protein